MTRPGYPFGFRVVGPVSETRRLVDAAAAFSAHAACDPQADINAEVYLSAFRFGGDFRNHLSTHGTTKGYVGPCWSPWLWIDIDQPGDPNAALHDARKLVGFILQRYRALNDDDLLTFFSGSKGFHIGIPLAHNPEPSPSFHLITRRLAEGLATAAGVKIDTAIYDRVRCFRAPNSKHPKTGRHKRRLTQDELFKLTSARIADLAHEPVTFGYLCEVAEPDTELAADWVEATATLQQVRGARAVRADITGRRLQRDTLEFIRNGAEEGERHTRLFRAAGNLREFNASPELIDALLTEAALDSGLSPSEAARQIRCGIEHADRQVSTTKQTDGGAQ